MSERLPYEEQLQQQWNDLPLPDENSAWADMKRRLEEDDNRPPVAWWRRGCALWGLLLIVLLGIGWWLAGGKREQPTATNSLFPANSKNKLTNTDTGYNQNANANVGITQPRQENDSTNNEVPAVLQENGELATGVQKQQQGNYNSTAPVNQNNDTLNIGLSSPQTKKKGREKATARNIRNSHTTKDNPASVPSEVISASNYTVIYPVMPADSNTVKQDAPVSKDSIKQPAIVAIDSAKKVTKKENKITTPVNTKSPQGKSIFFSGGIAMQQLIPVGGQKLTPYGSSGRKGSLLDYIPSVYIRLNKKDENNKDKWFIQGEFKYGAPQYTRRPAQTYFSKVDTIVSGQLFDRSSATIKKTFYHQVPLTFNYYVAPNWSIGTGIIFNKFSNSVTELKRTRVDLANNDSTEVISLVSEKSDSVFARSYLHAVFETQYKYKRFSFGARYAMGLQPFITFTLPGGIRSTEKNTSLQVFIRYDLFGPGNKK